MNGIKLLADTNVVIGLEDSRPIQASFAELARLCGEHGVHLFIDDVAHFADVNRDRDEARRATTLSKLAKFQQLSGLHLPSEPDLVTRFGPINNDNDRSDVRLLAALDAKAVDILVTQDNGLHRRAERVGLGNNVLTVEDALEWLRQTFSQQVVSLPYVAERKAYQINRKDEIFASLRGDYPDFDGWFDKCCNAHRDCWILELGDQIGGIVIRKEETHAAAGTRHRGPKILKVCTFKVRDEYQMLAEVFTVLTWLDDGWSRHGDPKNGYAVALLAKFWLEEKGDVPQRTRNRVDGSSDKGLLFIFDVVECVINNVREFNETFELRSFDGSEKEKDGIEEMRRKVMNHLKREGRRLREAPTGSA